PGTIVSEKAMTGFSGQGGSAPPFPIGMDFRPGTGGLYVLMSDNNLYTINTTTGVAHLEGQLAVGSATIRAFNFDPERDHVRAISTDQQSFELMPNGAFI